MEQQKTTPRVSEVLAYQTYRKQTQEANVKRLRRLIMKGLIPQMTEERMTRLFFCGEHLLVGEDPNTGLVRTVTRGCRDRLCPICEAKEARKNFVRLAGVIQVLRDAKDEKGNAQFYLLKGCFTVPNVPLDQLAEKTSQMSKAVSRMNNIYFKRHGSLGMWISAEFSYNPFRDDYHPHIHFIMVMPGSYKYVSHDSKEWLDAETVRKHFMAYMHQDDIQDFDFGKLDLKDNLFEFVKYNSKPMTQEMQKKLKYSGALQEKYLDGVLLGKVAVQHSCHIRSTGIVKTVLKSVKEALSADDYSHIILRYQDDGTVVLTPVKKPVTSETGDNVDSTKKVYFPQFGEESGNAIIYREFSWNTTLQAYEPTRATFEFMLEEASSGDGHLRDQDVEYFEYVKRRDRALGFLAYSSARVS